MNRRSLVIGLSAALGSFGRTAQLRAEAMTASLRARHSAEPASHPRAGAVVDSEIVDPRSRRKIKLRLRIPHKQSTSPLIVYSPGLGSGLSNGAAWCETWWRAGYIVANLAHPGTDDGIWDTSRQGLQANLSQALAPSQYELRIQDCWFAIEHCLAHETIGPLIEPSHIGVAGHSFGALTVQALASAQGSRGNARATLAAAIALSPGARSSATIQGLGRASIPFFCVTGDHDNYVTFGRGPEARRLGMPLKDRLAVYRSLPKGAKELLVLGGADHMTFAGEAVSTARYSRDVASQHDPAAWLRVAALTTRFWRYYFGEREHVERETYLRQSQAWLRQADRMEAS